MHLRGVNAGRAVVAVSAARGPQLINMINWVKNGYRPTNPLYNGASYPGDPSTVDSAGNAWPAAGPTIGAMAYLAPSTSQVTFDGGFSTYFEGGFGA